MKPDFTKANLFKTDNKNSSLKIGLVWINNKVLTSNFYIRIKTSNGKNNPFIFLCPKSIHFMITVAVKNSGTTYNQLRLFLNQIKNSKVETDY